MNTKYIVPHWHVPKFIQAATTTRNGGFSLPPFTSFNLADHVEDNHDHVLKNRALLRETLQLPSEPLWLNQQHTSLVVDATNPTTLNADGAYTNQKNVVCAIMTADCLPLLLCDKNGDEIAALHVGWRGLLNGIIENGIKQFQSAKQDIIAWLGPAISHDHFEIEDDVRKSFIHYNTELGAAFTKKNDRPKWLMDIYQAARIQLQQQGIFKIYGGEYCTVKQNDLFYSYRQEGMTGRMATLIWKQC